MNQEKILDISWGTIVKFSVAALLVYILFLIKQVLILVLFGLVISLIFDPVVDFLQKRKIPRVVAAVGMYLFVFGVIAFMIFGTAPLFISEIQRFSQLLPQYFEKLAPSLSNLGVSAFSDASTFLGVAVGGIEKISSSLFSALFAIFGGIFSTLFVISIAIFLSIEEKSIERFIAAFFPKKYEVLGLDVWAKSQKKVSAWFLMRILSCVFVGLATYISLLIFNVQYPISLGVFSAVSNFIPVVGPLTMSIFLFLLVALDSLPKAILILVAFVLIQQIEGNVVTPLLTKKIIGLSPTLVLISLAIGGALWGIMGAILAIPLAGILFEFVRDFLKKRKEERILT